MTAAASWRSQRPKRVCGIIERAANAYHIMPRMVLKGSNEPMCVKARRQAIRDLRGLGFSTPLIGRMLGGLHHTTVLYHLQDTPPPAPHDYGAPDESGLWI